MTINKYITKVHSKLSKAGRCENVGCLCETVHKQHEFKKPVKTSSG
jgi:hypothetical protein